MVNTRKVLVIASFPNSLINFRYQLLKAMTDQKYTVIACAAEHDPLSGLSGGDIALQLARIGVEYHVIPIERTGTNPLRDIRTLIALVKYCRKVSPDVILSYTTKPVIYGSIAGRFTGVSSIFSLITGLGFGLTAESSHASLSTLIVRKLYRFALASNKTVIFQNPDDLAVLRNNSILAKDAATAIVNGSGVDLNYFTPSVPPVNPITFLLITRLHREKGVVEYAEAARLITRKYPQARFIIVGPVDSHPDAITEMDIRMWEQEGIVSWAGPVSDVRAYIASSSVYVLPSYHEGTPRTVLEAMAMGRPILTTNAPGCRETVVDGENGYLVPVRDAAALAEGMERFIINPELIMMMGKRSREIAEEKYDVHKVNAMMLQVLGLTP